MSGYKFDVFLSYRRGQKPEPGGDWPLEPDGRWVHDVFFPSFRHWLEQSLPHAPRIAFDRDLPPGSRWEPTLKAWLKQSRCLVAVWNPPYFRSKFCRSEFHSMLKRQDAVNPAGDESGPRLVLPLAYWDGEWFDDEARKLECDKGFSKYSKYTRPIRDDEVAAAGFTTKMQEFCGRVAAAIQAAPAFDPSFPWCDVDGLPPAHAYPVPRLQ